MSVVTMIQEAVGVKADGVCGPKTVAAIAAKLGCPATAKAIQEAVGATADGIIGPRTLAAVAQKLELGAAVPSQAEVRSGKSIYGKAGDESNLVRITPPYQLYYEGVAVPSIRCHKLVADDLLAALNDVLAHYGAERLHKLGLDCYSGCFNDRSTVAGKSKSMHAWGIAVDFDAEHNAYAMRSPQARFSGEEYRAFIDIMEWHGFASMGRRADKDWMHFQHASF